MHRLREQQLAFATALAGSTARLNSMAAGAARVSTATAAAVYRNNVVEGFRKALALGFPVIERLVGSGYFAQLSEHYRESHPSRCGDLNGIGAAFASFLQRNFGGSEFDYLADVARLEWACQEVACAAAAATLSLHHLGAVDPDRYPELRLQVQPAVRFVQSRYPIVLIWSSNQPDAPAQTVDLGAGEDHVLVTRRPGGAVLYQLTPACFRLGVALAAGAPLGDAIDAAGLADTPYELSTALNHLFTLRAFSSLREH